MGRACGDLAATAEKKARANRAAAAKKAAEAAALAAAQPAVQRSPTTGLPIPEYSKSDAPQGYAPPVATPPAAPTHAAH